MSTDENFGTLDQFIIPLCKNQDVIFSGESFLITEEISEKFYYGVLIDGHGTNFFINFLKTLDWNLIVSSPIIEDELNKILQEFYLGNIFFYESSGSTLIIMRAFNNRIETISIGDSTVIIYKNGNIAYRNDYHTVENLLEFERLKNLDSYVTSFFTEMNSPRIKNSTELYAKKNVYNHFKKDVSLAMTQAIGHNGITGFSPEKHIELYDSSDIIRVVIGSDGLFDMLLVENRFFKQKDYTEKDTEDLNNDYIDINFMNAESLCKKSEKRWKKQDWIYHYDESNYSKFVKIGFDGYYDDISVLIFNKI